MADEVTTYFLSGKYVYLVDIDQDYAYVYSREGKFVGAGEGFTDYLAYAQANSLLPKEE